MTVTTPTLRASGRRHAFWMAAGASALLLAVLIFAGAGGASPTGDPLGADNASPEGARAVLEVLRDAGVAVAVAESLDEARGAIADPAATTLLIYDRGPYLDAERLREARSLVSEVILVEPVESELAAVAEGLEVGGTLDEAAPADARGCSLAPARQVKSALVNGTTYRIGDTAAWQGCLETDSEHYSLMQTTSGSSSLTVLGAPGVLSNDLIDEADNAALALALLGAQESLVWYLPGVDELPEDAYAAPAPPWVTPVMLLAAAVAVAASVWRGRRFGPLVIEDLPVVVPASETTDGRARLYRRAGDRDHALDQLRMGALGRLAAMLGLGSRADWSVVADAVAARLGLPPAHLRDVLVHRSPVSDREFVELARELAELERRLAAAVRPGGHPDSSPTTKERP